MAGAGEPGAHEITTVSWIKRQPALNRQLVNALGLDLDAGEAEAIALAMECQADLILLDERMGRHAAQRMALKVTGTLGILIAAKDRGLLPSVRPLLDALRADAGFWIGDALYGAVVAAAGESAHWPESVGGCGFPILDGLGALVEAPLRGYRCFISPRPL